MGLVGSEWIGVIDIPYHSSPIQFSLFLFFALIYLIMDKILTVELLIESLRKGICPLCKNKLLFYNRYNRC